MEAHPRNQPHNQKKTVRLSSKEPFTKQNIENVLAWLEYPANFDSVFGTGGQTSVGKPDKRSNQGYAILAEVVSKQSMGRLNLNAKAMHERFRRHRRTYATARESSGFGVTDEDRKNGIYTIAHKLESMCTCYARMDALFGHPHNITPLSAFCSSNEVDQEQDNSQ